MVYKMTAWKKKLRTGVSAALAILLLAGQLSCGCMQTAASQSEDVQTGTAQTGTAQTGNAQSGDAQTGTAQKRVFTRIDRYIPAYFTSRDQVQTLHLVSLRDMAYIRADDLAAAAGMQVHEETGKNGSSYPVFTRDGSVFRYEVRKDLLSYQGDIYLPLRENAFALHVRYMYDESRQILVFRHTQMLPEDLCEMALYLLRENEESHAVARL